MISVIETMMSLGSGQWFRHRGYHHQSNTDFSYETKYYIKLTRRLGDAINNSYSGITEATTWTFTTEDVPICPVVAHALTYDAYPTCNPTSCKPGYVLSAGVCKLSSGGSFSILSLGRDDSDEHISTSSTEHIAQIKTQGTDMQLNYQFSRDLKLSTSNEEVRELQKYLNAHGFYRCHKRPLLS